MIHQDTKTHRCKDWDDYRMDYSHPHEALEPEEREVRVIGAALMSLVDANILPHARYDHVRMLAHRNAVRDLFEIPWTGILYLDADGTDARGKGVYLDILQAGYERMPAGSLVLAHNSVNCAERLAHYLAYVRDTKHFHASVNVIIDGEGLEVSAK